MNEQQKLERAHNIIQKEQLVGGVIAYKSVLELIKKVSGVPNIVKEMVANAVSDGEKEIKKLEIKLKNNG